MFAERVGHARGRDMHEGSIRSALYVHDIRPKSPKITQGIATKLKLAKLYFENKYFDSAGFYEYEDIL